MIRILYDDNDIPIAISLVPANSKAVKAENNINIPPDC